MSSVAAFRQAFVWLRSPSVTLWMLVLLTLLFGFVAVGLSFGDSIAIAIAMVLYSMPWFLIVRFRDITEWSLVGQVSIALGASVMTLSMLFAFTQLARSGGAFWFTGTVATALVVVLKWRFGQDARSGIKGSWPKSPVLVASFLTIFAAFSLGLTHPISVSNRKWVPDDYPLFAEWGKSLGAGGGPESILDGFTLKYHWLSYALSGGLDRLFTGDYLIGPMLTVPVIAWVGLGLGSIALSKMLTRSNSAALLSVAAVLFASNLGIRPFSTGGLGGLATSPSHLLASALLLTAFLIAYGLLDIEERRWLSWGLLFCLGFVLMMMKATTWASFVLAVAVLAAFQQEYRGHCSWTKRLVLATKVLPAVIGGAVAYVLFIQGHATQVALEDGLQWSSNVTLSSYVVQLLPVGAYAFSIAAWLVPGLLLLFTRVRNNPIVLAGSVLAILGALAALVLQLRDSNETWFLKGSLAIILPVSAFAISRVLGDEWGGLSPRAKTLLVLIATTYVGAATAFLVLGRDSETLLLRPWLLPSTLLAGAVIGALLVAVLPRVIPLANLRKSALRLAGIASSLLFLVSVTYGASMRLQATISMLLDERSSSAGLDSWLGSAEETANSLKDVNEDGVIAVYSRSVGEQTLHRWIPYFAGARVYHIRDDDLVHLVYLEKDGDSMAKRQELVRRHVENQSVEACRQLEADGVTHVWMTPNANFSAGQARSAQEHSVESLTC